MDKTCDIKENINNVYFKLDDNFEAIISNAMLDKKINRLKLVPTGWTNIVYEVETDEGNYFFRFPRDEFWSRTIVKDYEFAKYIYGKTKYNTIKLELLYHNGRPFSMHKKIEGIALAEKMSFLDEKEIIKISTQIAEFMNELHKLEYNSKEIFTIENIGLQLSDFIDELLNVHVSNEDKMFWNKGTSQSETKCLVHGDLNSSNIILDENNNIAGIIDFGFGGYGNKYDDISRIIGRCPEKFKKHIVEFYEEHSGNKLDEKYLDTNIGIWSNIDNAYINYMRTIGIYK